MAFTAISTPWLVCAAEKAIAAHMGRRREGTAAHMRHMRVLTAAHMRGWREETAAHLRRRREVTGAQCTAGVTAANSISGYT